jgi:serine phosphatase RsbU (regulator of sigma subunit)
VRFSFLQTKPEKSAGLLRRVLHFALYDWTRDMSWSSRLLTTLAFLIQLGALVFALLEPKSTSLMLLALFIYMTGLFLMNGTLTSEFVRKTQLEADQIAAQQIQQTLHPQNLEELPGYQLAMFYKPLRGVGGDYFDIITLPDGRTLFALADVSGKGMPAALLAANIQALVRSISNVTPDPLSVANHVNHHLCSYTPPERFATAVFALLSPETGELTYVNAGQNPPILSSSGRAIFLESTGIPLGLVREAQFQCQRVIIPLGGKLLFFTDGLTDGIEGPNPEELVCEAIRNDPVTAMSSIKSLLSPKFNEDDITILLLTRLATRLPPSGRELGIG